MKKSSYNLNRSRRRGQYNEFKDYDDEDDNDNKRISSSNNNNNNHNSNKHNDHHDNDYDEIKPFATFDNKDDIILNTGRKDMTIENNNHNHKKVQSRKNKSNGRRRREEISPTHPNNKNSIIHPTSSSSSPSPHSTKSTQLTPTIEYTRTISSDYDSIAASDYKWAKIQATKQLTKKSLGKPAVGLVRSISAGRDTTTTNNNNSRMNIDIGSESRSKSNKRDYYNNTNNSEGNDEFIRKEKIRTRQRSKSPSLSSRAPPQHPLLSKQYYRDSSTSPIDSTTSSNSKNNMNKPKNNSHHRKIPNIKPSSTKSNNSRSRSKLHHHEQPPLSKEEIQLRKHYSKKQYTFQNPFHELVSYRVYDLSSRIAFDNVQPPVSMNDLESYASKLNLYGDKSIQSRMNKLSPSPEYVELMGLMSKISKVRQLCWSPSVSCEADPFSGWEYKTDGDDDSFRRTETIEGQGISSAWDTKRRKKAYLEKKREAIIAKRFGLGYKQIDVEEYVKDVLLDHVPLLTNVKRRLPMRSDVGFPRATEEEINSKQLEVAREAQLEEISPRLIVMLSSNDVGRSLNRTVDSIFDKNVLRNLKYKLKGMPFASKEMYMIKNMQKKSSIVLKDDDSKVDLRERIEHNQFSIFAPPIDSIVSSSEMWKSPPFSDRPVGLSHAVAIPLCIKFSAGNKEPLICTLALYSLPKASQVGSGTLRGKISEDFIFPAGDNWGDLLENEKASDFIARQFGMKDNTNGNRRKGRKIKKALFSFDTMALPRNENNDVDSLYLVLNVHKVSHRDAGMGYNNKHNRKTTGGFFFGATGGGTSTPSSHQDVISANKRANDVFNTFGCQYITPFCFGLVPLFPKDMEFENNNNERIEWPHCVTQCMAIFSHPAHPESHDAFLDRISNIARTTNLHSHIIDEVPVSNGDNYSFDDDSNIIAVSSDDSISSQNGGSKRVRSKFNFRKRKNSKTPLLDTASNVDNNVQLLDATAIFCTSKAGPDFAQLLLQQPPLLDREESRNQNSPRLLVDACGDCAIMLNPELKETSKQNRSNLIRLPQSSRPSGYLDSYEIKEVLYMPFQYDLPYYSSLHFGPRAPINVLYLQPSLLKKVSKSNDSDKFRNLCYSVRVQLVQKQVIEDDTGSTSSTFVPIKCIYNPTPGGEALLESVYTKIPLGCTEKLAAVDIYRGIPLQDEIKIRLPDMLDGSHYLKFCVYSIVLKSDDNDNSALIENALGDMLIPLSSNSTKESIYGNRVTTVIPDGLHRIQIENFQLQVKSRLASTIHICDPKVAAIIRDFVYAGKNMFETTSDTIDKYREISCVLSKASNQSIYSNFSTLVFMCLRSFANVGQLQYNYSSKRLLASTETSLILELLHSLLTIITKSKKSLDRSENQHQWKRLMKIVLDTFDEYYFNNNIKKMSSSTMSIRSISNISVESESNANNGEDTQFNQKEVERFEYPQKRSTEKTKYTDMKILHARYADNATPFSRTAYGVSKIDMMKAEAELYDEFQTLSELHEDDETVFTATTLHSHIKLTPSVNSFSIKKSRTTDSVSRAPSRILKYSRSSADTVVSPSDHFRSFSPLDRARSMARRVNNLAQVFLAPCTAPDVDASIHSPVSRRLNSILKEKFRVNKNEGGLIGEYKQKHHDDDEKYAEENVYISGSDVDDYFEDNSIDIQQLFPHPNSVSGVRLRGINKQLDILTFCFQNKMGPINNALHSPFLYEVLLVICLHLSNRDVQDSSKESHEFELFIENIDFILPLCMKSLALRCLKPKRFPQITTSYMFDANHMIILESCVEAITSAFVRQVTNTKGSVEQTIQLVLKSNEIMIEFLVGLLTLIHPSQISWIISRYFEFLRQREEDQEVSNENMPEALAVIQLSRQLRLQAAEKLACIPRFVAFNFPCKIHPYRGYGSKGSFSWTNQLNDRHVNNESSRGSPDRLPEMNWLSNIVLNECFLICTRSCDAIVNKAIFEVQSKPRAQGKKSAMRKRINVPKESLERYNSIGNHSISIIYDLVLRAHAIDCQHQSPEAKERIASMFLSTIIDNALLGVMLLSKLQVGDKIRNVWLLSVLYVLQEAPEMALRHQMRGICTIKPHTKESDVGRFIRILKLCTTTFQSFTDSKYLSTMAPWLLQESFNIISATSIVLVDECYEILSHTPHEQSRMIEGILDLLLQINSSPLSSVTLVRALGASSQVLETIGSSQFIAVVDDDLQHWGRIILSMMNSTSLSVRSMAVDWTISLFGSLFQEDGNIDEVAQMFLSVLPEIVAREIALYCGSGLIINMKAVESTLWPLRRAIADVEEADPIDDERVDLQLTPFLRRFCRVCQAIMDGVLIELRLQGNDCNILNSKIMMTTGKSGRNNLPLTWQFDADEESLFEAASYFLPETSPMQRIRWLLTLKRLHEAKGQWIEAGETLILCAKTVAEAIPHIHNVWRPSQFSLWTDPSVAPWLMTICTESQNSKINAHVMAFARDFLEPRILRDVMDLSLAENEGLRLHEPTIPVLCAILTRVSKESVDMYERETGMASLAFKRLEELLKIVMDYSSTTVNMERRGTRLNKTQTVEEIAVLRKVSTSINQLITKMTGRILQFSSEKERHDRSAGFNFLSANHKDLFFVRIQLTGKKSDRFLESTTIPTFLDWDVPYICRVPNQDVLRAVKKVNYIEKNEKRDPSHLKSFQEEVCKIYAESFISFLKEDLPNNNIKVCTEPPNDSEIIESDNNTLYFCVSPVHVIRSGKDRSHHLSKKFCFRSTQQLTEEITVANHFPCALSRQASLMTRTRLDTSFQHGPK